MAAWKAHGVPELLPLFGPEVGAETAEGTRLPHLPSELQVIRRLQTASHARQRLDVADGYLRQVSFISATSPLT